ncbi:MAG TPA: glutathione S-transferase family protein [Candidatus Limnocylindria bacterium]|jgi:glutathione S-transferase|nr:glutathione S-transferase family protein [Candidatus Limnocylindria bacterium]
MSLTVYQLPHSPYCLPIIRALEALGVAHEVVNVSNADRGEIIRLTKGAYYQVPVLKLDDRLVFDGSEAGADGLDVARQVDRVWGGGRLFPETLAGLQALLVPHIEGELEGVMFKLADLHYVPAIADPVERTMVIRHKERRFGRGCLDEWRANREMLFAQAGKLLVPFDQMLVCQPFLLGAQPVYADFALYGVLANLTYNEWNPFPPGHARLADWFTRIKQFRYV